jgi:hypothetical protein
VGFFTRRLSDLTLNFLSTRKQRRVTLDIESLIQTAIMMWIISSLIVA